MAQIKIMEYFKKAAEPVNGWMYLTKDIGVYGTDYIQRALVTAIGLGANRPQDAIYPTTQKDGTATSTTAPQKNTSIHFNKGDMPPVNGFWSITMYDKDYFFVPNPLNRYTLAPATSSSPILMAQLTCTCRLTRRARQRKPTGCLHRKRQFIPMMRLYWPKDTPPSIIDGTWKPPASTRQNN